MDDVYDFVVLGTGITECVLSWALASKGKRVLQIDKNATYGSDLRTLKYSEMEHWYGSSVVDEELQSLDTQFSIDLVPKLMLADGDVWEFLSRLNIPEVVDFVAVPGSFIYKHKKIHTIPASEADAIKSGVVGFLQKPRVVGFFWDVNKYCKADSRQKRELRLPQTMREYFKNYGLDKDSQEFVGHAIALNLDDGYLDRDPRETLDKIHLFVRSILALGKDIRSPYIYPLYGSSEISQAFSRKAAINGAVFRLNTPIIGVEKKDGIFCVEIEDRIENTRCVVKTRNLLGEPLYFLDKVTEVKRVIHSTCIVKGNVDLIRGAPSAQVIFLASELKRRNDIFLLVLGERERATPKGFKIAMISTVLETQDPESEIAFVTSKLGNVVRTFIEVRSLYEPTTITDGIFISKTVDQSTHFESLYSDIQRLGRETGVGDVFARLVETTNI